MKKGKEKERRSIECKRRKEKKESFEKKEKVSKGIMGEK